MANVVPNRAKGKIAEKLANFTTGIQVIPLSAIGTDEAVRDAGSGNGDVTITTFLTDASATEQTGSTWVRKSIANASVTVTVDETNNLVKAVIPDQTWTAVAAANNTVALIIAQDDGTDATDVVLTKHDFAVTTDGNDVTADFDATNGFWQAS